TEVRPLNGSDEAYVEEVLRTFGASDPRPNASLQAIIDAYPRREEAAWTVTDAMPFSSARKYSGAAFAEADGTASAWLLGAPDVLLSEDDTTLAEIEQLNQQGLRVLLLARVRGDGLDAPGAAAGAAPTALVVLEQRLRPDAG
ncbi:cation-translocating P-type ATPase, partial [Streptomyces sp. SID7982]|nr:cation-translocating P-type ATPase [Streptomyces sp. SID7982]